MFANTRDCSTEVRQEEDGKSWPNPLGALATGRFSAQVPRCFKFNLRIPTVLNSDLERCCDCQFFTPSPFFSGLTLFLRQSAEEGRDETKYPRKIGENQEK